MRHTGSRSGRFDEPHGDAVLWRIRSGLNDSPLNIGPLVGLSYAYATLFVAQ